MKKIRLDSLLVSRGLVDSREKARALILEGKVTVNGLQAIKAGAYVRPDSTAEIVADMPYVSRGGVKLEAALENFHLDVKGMVAMDIGASTGGFTDCLLKHGSRMVYAIDVGYGQFDWKLRNDPAVVLLEKTNIRYLKKETIRSPIDIATIDVSFISLLKVIPGVLKFLKPGGEILALIKPQFEAGRKDVGRKGVIRDEAKRTEVIEKIKAALERMSLEVKGVMTSPIRGRKGNVEYFMWVRTRPVDADIN